MKAIRLILGGLVLAMLASGVTAKTMQQWAQEYGIRNDASYDAVRVMETKDGQLQFKERKAPQKMLMEVSMGGMNGLVIRREDLNKAFFFMPEMGMYRTMKIREANKQSFDGMQVSKVVEVGRETVNGFASRKFKTQFKDQHGKGAGFMWITDDGIPIKADMIYKNRGMKGERMKIELRELNVRTQDPAHFELPPNLQAMNIGAMMNMARRKDQNTGGRQVNQNPGSSSEEPSLVEDVAEAGKDEARTGVVSETRKAVRDGIRGLFRRP